MGRKPHPITTLHRDLALKARVRGEIRTIDGNRVLFCCWVNGALAAEFIRDTLPLFMPDGYRWQMIDICGLTAIVITKVQTDSQIFKNTSRHE